MQSEENGADPRRFQDPKTQLAWEKMQGRVTLVEQANDADRRYREQRMAAGARRSESTRGLIAARGLSRAEWRRLYPNHLDYLTAWNLAHGTLTQEQWRTLYPHHLSYIAAWNTAHAPEGIEDDQREPVVQGDIHRHPYTYRRRKRHDNPEGVKRQRLQTKRWLAQHPGYARNYLNQEDAKRRARRLVQGACLRAQDCGRDYDQEWLHNWAKNPATNCAYCENLFVYPPKTVGDGSTIDRVDNTKGYVAGNVVLACRRCNTIKNAATLQDLENFTRVVRQHVEQNSVAA